MEPLNLMDSHLANLTLTEETLEWLEWYNSLSQEEQLAVSSIPADLYTSDDVGTSDSDAEE